MDDRFLKDYHKPPRREFQRALEQRLESQSNKAEKMNTKVYRPLAFGALTVFLALVLVLAASPAARAQVLEFVREVGGVSFTETGRYPGQPEHQVTIVPSETYTLATMHERVGYEISLPAWVPEGFTLDDEVTITDFSAGSGDSDVMMSSIRWRSPQPDWTSISLNVSKRTSGEPMNWLTGPESVEEVQVNGQPAALVRGSWNANAKQWDASGHISLHWQHNGLSYALQTWESEVSTADLIRMAESIP
jgi:hypothetical protein